MLVLSIYSLFTNVTVCQTELGLVDNKHIHVHIELIAHKMAMYIIYMCCKAS